MEVFRGMLLAFRGEEPGMLAALQGPGLGCTTALPMSCVIVNVLCDIPKEDNLFKII